MLNVILLVALIGMAPVNQTPADTVRFVSMAVDHARELFPDEEILLHAESAVARPTLDRAAAVAELSVGHAEEVVVCGLPLNRCRARGDIRTQLTVTVREADATSAVVLATIHRFPEQPGPTLEIVDALHARCIEGRWQVVRVERVSIS